MTRPRLGVRLRLWITVVIAVGVALAIGVAAANYLLGQKLSASATDLAHAQAEAKAASLRIAGGRIVTPRDVTQGGLASHVWVFSKGRLLQSPRASRSVEAAALTLARGGSGSFEMKEKVRLYAVPVVRDGTRYGTVVAAVSLAPYEETGRAALIASSLLALALLGAVAAASWWMLGRALLPVSRMTEDANAWSEHDLDRRFALGEPYDELTRLAATLDGLLERIASSIRHEQRFAAEVSHELRTPLARAKGQTELMLRRERTPDEYRAALEAVDRNIDEMTKTVETLMAAARHEAAPTRTTSDLREAVATSAETVRPQAPMPVRLHLAPQPVRVSADRDLLVRIVQPLLDNACRYGRSGVDVRVSRTGSAAEVEIADDGPGVAEEECEAIFEPGTRGTAGSASRQGAGLGLALARRLARSVGGDITAVPSGAGGRFTLRLPLA